MQSDLFNLSMSNSFERQAFQRSFFERKYTLRFDQLLGVSIALIVFFVMVFAWGAEHGKAVSHREMARQAMPVVKEAPAVTVAAPAATVAPMAAAAALPARPAPAPALTEMVASDAPATLNAPSSMLSDSEPAVMPASQSVDVSTADTIQSGAKYTIASVTYVKKEQAADELERIKAKGYTPILVSSGKYYQLCVNGFETRQSANEAMKNLRTKGIVSSDSYVRNMPVS